MTLMYIKVRATPKAKKETREKKAADHFLIAVKEPAERGGANARVREILAEEFQIPIARVRLISGHTSPSKIFSVDLDHLENSESKESKKE